MLRRTYIFLLLIVFNNIKVHGQLTLKEPAISYVKIDSSYFAIAQRPVTNKEYIIYLTKVNFRLYSI